jgi:hypothetical protein
MFLISYLNDVNRNKGKMSLFLGNLKTLVAGNNIFKHVILITCRLTVGSKIGASEGISSGTIVSELFSDHT